ncbi:hypothetical protein [Roseateles sp. BYS96W]
MTPRAPLGGIGDPPKGDNMATTKTLATAIPAAKLTAAINKAVGISAKKLQLEVQPENIVHKWDLVGRVLADASLAHEFATDVTKQLKAQGIKADAATFIVNKQIIAGFIERGRIGELREL